MPCCYRCCDLATCASAAKCGKCTEVRQETGVGLRAIPAPRWGSRGMFASSLVADVSTLALFQDECSLYQIGCGFERPFACTDGAAHGGCAETEVRNHAT
jgi:hypothetical protein